MSASAPVCLPVRFLEKVWGATDLSPWYPHQAKKIGEVWFEADLPLLVKFIFTTERLSVQVHPDDAFAGAHENCRGKTEMWYVLRADPGAQVGIGFRESLTREQLREAALDGRIERLLNWIDVRAGDAFFMPPGTVHAIGPGLAMCEIQQHSDVTYRLYDYGRPRELHLEKGVQVALTEATRPCAVRLPIDCPYFHSELFELTAPMRYQPEAARFHVVIVLAGSGTIAGQPLQPGQAWLIPQGSAPFSLAPDSPVKLLRTWVP